MVSKVVNAPYLSDCIQVVLKNSEHELVYILPILSIHVWGNFALHIFEGFCLFSLYWRAFERCQRHQATTPKTFRLIVKWLRNMQIICQISQGDRHNHIYHNRCDEHLFKFSLLCNFQYSFEFFVELQIFLQLQLRELLGFLTRLMLLEL